MIYDKWNISPEKNYSLLQKFPANDAVNNLESDNIYSTLKKPSISSREANDYDSQDCIDYDDEDAVYATVNFNRNSVNSVICDQRMNDGDQNHNQKIITVSNDVHDLYAKIDVNKKKKVGAIQEAPSGQVTRVLVGTGVKVAPQQVLQTTFNINQPMLGFEKCGR